MAITVTGTRTGRDYTFPVQYAREGDTIWVLPGHPETKTWWRNLRAGAPVHLHVEGADVVGTAVAISGDADPEEAVRGLRAYLRRTPAAARAVGVAADADDEALWRAAARCVLVRIDLETAGATPQS
jgi:deazaflavin-dependent oxidoreductase (nitroreductase family)